MAPWALRCVAAVATAISTRHSDASSAIVLANDVQPKQQLLAAQATRDSTSLNYIMVHHNFAACIQICETDLFVRSRLGG